FSFGAGLGLLLALDGFGFLALGPFGVRLRLRFPAGGGFTFSLCLFFCFPLGAFGGFAGDAFLALFLFSGLRFGFQAGELGLVSFVFLAGRQGRSHGFQSLGLGP